MSNIRLEHFWRRRNCLQIYKRSSITRKAIDVIDEAGAAQRILPKSKQKKSIGKLEIEDIISKIARIPAQTVNADDKKLLLKLDRNLKNVVFGQDRAIDLLTGAIKMSRSGLGKKINP